MIEPLILYTQCALSEKKWVERHSIPKKPDEFIPVKVVNSTTKRSKKWYSIKYLDKDEVLDFIKSTKKSWKRKNKK